MKRILSLLTLTTLTTTMALNAEIALPTTFKTDFSQTLTNENGKVIKYEGTVLFKRMKTTLSAQPSQNETSRNLFKWSYTKPTQKEVCTDGMQFIVVDHDLEQVATYFIDNGINLEEIVKLAKPISKTNYTATYKDVEYLITLNENQQLQKIVYVDSMENKVKILFNNMSYNPEVELTSLECNAPVDYDIIKG